MPTLIQYSLYLGIWFCQGESRIAQDSLHLQGFQLADKSTPTLSQLISTRRQVDAHVVTILKIIHFYRIVKLILFFWNGSCLSTIKPYCVSFVSTNNDFMLIQCWVTICDGCPSLNQREMNVWLLPRLPQGIQLTCSSPLLPF